MSEDDKTFVIVKLPLKETAGTFVVRNILRKGDL